MKVAVAIPDVPFVEGGHLVIARELVRSLRLYGHEAELVFTPMNPLGKVLLAYGATAAIDLRHDGNGRPIDRVVSFRYPTFVLNHPGHTLWLCHRLREYYDLWEEFQAPLPTYTALAKERLRRLLVHGWDKRAFKRLGDRVFTISDTVGARLTRWGGHPWQTLYPPAPERAYRTEGYEKSIFAVSRLVSHKRVGWVIEALPYMENKDVRVRIAGEGPEEEKIRARVQELGLTDRVTLLGRVDEEGLIREYSRCGLVFFAPLKEDYGFVTVEAFKSRKAVITTDDSGGAQELVGKSGAGIVTPPDSRETAKALDKIFSAPSELERLGEIGLRWAEENLSWERAVKVLVS